VRKVIDEGNPQQYTKRILGYVDGKDSAQGPEEQAKKLQKLIKF